MKQIAQISTTCYLLHKNSLFNLQISLCAVSNAYLDKHSNLKWETLLHVTSKHAWHPLVTLKPAAQIIIHSVSIASSNITVIL